MSLNLNEGKGSTPCQGHDPDRVSTTVSRKWIGAHVSAAGGVENVPDNAKKIGAQAFALFTKNQRQWTAKPLTEENIEGFKFRCKEYGYSMDRVLPHASYLINIGNPKQAPWEKSRNALLDEMQRCEQLGITMINVHPGAHLKQIPEKECLSRIATAVNELHQETNSVTVVLEIRQDRAVMWVTGLNISLKSLIRWKIRAGWVFVLILAMRLPPATI